MITRRLLSLSVPSAVAALLLPWRARAQAVGVAGDLVTCIRNHPIARLSRSLSPGDPLGVSAFTDWHIPVPDNLDNPPPCPRCGGAWYQINPSRRVHLAGKSWVPN